MNHCQSFTIKEETLLEETQRLDNTKVEFLDLDPMITKMQHLSMEVNNSLNMDLAQGYK